MSDRESLCLHLFRVGADGPFLNVADRLWQHANGRQKCDKARKVLAPHGLGQAADPRGMALRYGVLIEICSDAHFVLLPVGIARSP